MHFVNESFRKGTYPNELKIGNVIPIYKNGNRLICSNYRPITKLSVLGKIFEDIILRRLKKF